MKLLRRVTGILAVLSCAMLVFRRMQAGAPLKAREAGAIGVIGGADGPTAIYVAAKITPFFQAAFSWLRFLLPSGLLYIN